MLSSKELSAPWRAYSSPARNAATGRACHASSVLSSNSVTSQRGPTSFSIVWMQLPIGSKP
eukprot:6918347-Lingulodinium_polyedra.AAC.1